MKILCVTGTRSNGGKTIVTESLLKKLDNWAACKVTICNSGRFHFCPKGTFCGACGSLKGNFAIVTDKRIIARKGKDTYRMLKAGAKSVFWIKASPRFVKEAVHNALKMLCKYEGVILEGNGAVKAVRPNLAVMVVSKDGQMKKSAREIQKNIDIFINDVNDDELIDTILRRLKLRREI